MNNINSAYLKEVDPAKKDAKWMNDVLQLLRRDWRQLIDKDRMAINKQIMFSQQDMEPIRKMFKDKQFKKETKFEALGILNRMVNTMIEEIMKNPPKLELKVNDATALSNVDADMRLLRYKGEHEKFTNAIASKIGMPPQVIGKDKFQSNIDEFTRMGLDANDPNDIDFYQQNNFPKLKATIAGQKIIDIIMKLNRFDEETLRSFLLDIWASLACCVQTYVDAVTGEIKYDRIYPEEAYGIWGDKTDGTNDIAQGWLKNLTVMEWLGRVGNEFTFEKDWSKLLWALNYCNNYKYTGFIRNGINYDCFGNDSLMEHPDARFNGADKSNLLDYSLAYTYKVYVGYMEFDSVDATATYLMDKKTGELMPGRVKYDYSDVDYFLEQKKENTEYTKESFYNQQMYKSYFLPTSGTSQWIYNWGKVYYQKLEGAFDQFAKGTLMYYRYEGTPPAEIAKPYIDFANLTFYRMKWAVYHAKPQKEQYIMEELVELAKITQKQFAQKSKTAVPALSDIIEKLIQFKHENFVDIRTYPKIEGKTIATLPQQDAGRAGLDPLVVALQAIEQWCEMQIAEKVGLNDTRLAAQQNDRTPFKQNQAATQSSYNSTGFMYRMIQHTKQHVGQMTLNYAQDIIKFEDTIPYNYLLKLIGETDMQNLKILKDFATQRYGLTIEDYSAQLERSKLIQLADMALNNADGKGGISLIEYNILIMTEDFKDGFRKLSLYKYKAEKKKNALDAQKQKIQNDHEEKMSQIEQQTEKMKGELAIQEKTITAQAAIQVASISAGSKEKIKDATIQNDAAKQQHKADDTKEVLTHKAELENQKPLNV
jgi:hypothetical protein